MSLIEGTLRLVGAIAFFIVGVAAGLHAATPTNAPAPRRIVSFSPALTEMLVAIGADGALVGISDFCRLPHPHPAPPRLGGTVNPNVELLLALNPDMVLLQGNMELVQHFCRSYGIRTASFLPDDFTSITNTLQLLGELTGCASSAAVVRAQLAARWNSLTTAAAQRPPVPAFVCIWREPDKIASFTVPSPHSFISQALAAAGGSNVCADVIGNYPTVALELVMQRAPRVIFDIVPSAFSTRVDAYMRAWQSYHHTPAGRHAVIVPVTNVSAMIPGPAIVALAEEFAATLHSLTNAPHR